MSDLGDSFRDWREHKQRKRAQNRDSSMRMLDKAGVYYEEKNMGAHLIVHCGNERVDFWPGTGLYMERDGTRGYGVRNLIKMIERRRTL